MAYSRRPKHFFHRAATGRHNKILIRRLKADTTDWIEEQEMFKSHVATYFCSLFLPVVRETDQDIIDKVKPSVTEYMNVELDKPYTRDEVKYLCIIWVI